MRLKLPGVPRTLVVAGVCAALFAALQPAAAQPPALDGAVRKEVVDKAAKALRDRYIFPDVAEKAAAKIEGALASGAYDSLSSPTAFANRLTEDLQSVTRDKHMKLRASGAPPDGPPPAPPPPMEAGFVRADRLPGNIGYVEVAGFPDGAAFQAAANAAMAKLADSSALIIDVRRNGGGSPSSVAYLESFFVPDAPQKLLLEFVNRVPTTPGFITTTQMNRPTPVKFIGKPVLVLTSERTFSGGEGFAYNMQAMKIARTVGALTGGGANPGGAGPVGPGFGLFVPVGRPVSPITKTNWEGVGVKPDIAVPTPEALRAALKELGQTVQATEVDALATASLWRPRADRQPGSEAALRRVLEELRTGVVDYDKMSSGVANATRTQLTTLQSRVVPLGAVQRVTFRGVGPAGADVYYVAFEKGGLEWRISATPEGLIQNINFGPPQMAVGEAERNAAFSAQDTDGDGKLDKAAYGRMLDYLGFAAQLESLFAQRDVNKDGFVTREELSPPVR